MTEPVAMSVVPGVSDKERADNLRHWLIEAVTPVLKLMDEADAAGLEIAFSLGKDFMGKSAITGLKILKAL